jgi:hypothetical protein
MNLIITILHKKGPGVANPEANKDQMDKEKAVARSV